MRKSLLTIFYCVIISVLFYSCSCSCACEDNRGCKIMTATNRTTGAVVQTNIVCSQTNYSTDKAVQDSVVAFYNRYSNLNTSVTMRDSLFKIVSYDDLNCKESEKLRKEGLSCFCAK